MMFTEEETLALALGLLSARRLGLSDAAPAAQGALSKLERVMPEALRERVQALEETVTPAVSAPPRLPAGGIVVALSDAVRQRRRVRIRYRSRPSEETDRNLDPYAVIHREGYWYTLGYCHLRKGRRLFRLDRVLETKLLEEVFSRPSGFESPERVLASLAAMQEDRWTVEVVLETSVEEARRQVPSIGVALEEAPDGRAVLGSSTSDLGWMARVLAGLDCPFVVREPPELSEALERRAEEIVALAKSIAAKEMKSRNEVLLRRTAASRLTSENSSFETV